MNTRMKIGLLASVALMSVGMIEWLAGATAAAAIAQHDLFHHQHGPRQGRGSRRAGGRGSSLPDAGDGGGRRQQDLARLPQHQRRRARRPGQCPRPHRDRSLAELQGRGRRAECRRSAQRQHQARHAELADRARHHGRRRRLHAELSRHPDRLDGGGPGISRQPQPDLQQLDERHLRQRHGRPHRPARPVGHVYAKSWNASHMSRSCSPDDLRATGGNGLFYCFAQ